MKQSTRQMPCLCNFWRQSHEPVGARLSRTAAPSPETDASLPTLSTSSPVKPRPPQGRPAINHNRAVTHSDRAHGTRERHRQEPVQERVQFVCRREINWENFYLRCKHSALTVTQDLVPSSAPRRTFSTLPALRGAGQPRQPASH